MFFLQSYCNVKDAHDSDHENDFMSTSSPRSASSLTKALEQIMDNDLEEHIASTGTPIEQQQPTNPMSSLSSPAQDLQEPCKVEENVQSATDLKHEDTRVPGMGVQTVNVFGLHLSRY